MAKGKFQYWKIRTIYPGTLYVVFTFKDLVSVYEKIGMPKAQWPKDDGDPGEFHYMNGPDGVRSWVIFIDVKKISKEQLDRTIVHESTHYVHRLAEFIETVFDKETQAYLMEYVVTAVRQAANEYKGKKHG